MSRQLLFSICHPKRKHHAKGLCVNCYTQKLRVTNREQINTRRRELVLQNINEVRRKNKEYTQKPEVKERNRIAKKKYRDKMSSNFEYKVLNNLRWTLWNLITKRNHKKASSTIDLIGCSVDALRNYLESKFQPNMSWKNYGKWHIDHVKPCASFDLSKSEQQRICFHYSNFQPLWAEENIRKGCKVV